MNYPGGPPPSDPNYRPYIPPPQIRFEAISEAWRLFTQQMGVWVLSILITGVIIGVVTYGLFFVVMLLLFGATGLSGAGSRGSSDPGPWFFLALLGTELVIGILVAILATFFMGGLHRMALKQMRGEILSVGDLFSAKDVYPALLGASLLMWTAFAAASITIVGGYILMGLWMLTIPLIVDRRMGVIEAMKASWNALKEQWLMAAAFCFVVGLVSSCGVFACYVGLLFSYPLYFLIHAVVYRDFFNPPGMYPAPSPYTAYPMPPPPNGISYPPPPPPGDYPPTNPPGDYPSYPPPPPAAPPSE